MSGNRGHRHGLRGSGRAADSPTRALGITGSGRAADSPTRALGITGSGRAADSPTRALGITLTGEHRRSLVTVLIITLGVAAAEAIGAWLSGALVLLADAAHMAADAAGVGVSLLAVIFAARPATARRTFGYARAEI